MRSSGYFAVKREGVGLDAVIAVEDKRRKEGILGAADIQICLSQSLAGHTEVRILAFRHRSNVRKRRQGLGGIQIVDDREIFVQRRK